MKRYCHDYIYEDLEKKMVFIGGPRQVGKTTLSKALCKKKFSKGEYFNWDYDENRRAIQKLQWQANSPLIIFDELHKFPRWKQWLKGLYDTKPDNQQFLVTGSARLDVYKRGGDSLLGRYHYWRLHPLSIDECPSHLAKHDGYERLLRLGGFPEPFLLGDEREAKRWRRNRFDRILKEDIRDLESVKNLQLLYLFLDALRERASSQITLANLAADLHIAPATAKQWLALTERMYITFAIYPYIKNIPRSIVKPPKVYFYDNADTVDHNGVRLENLVATTLLKRLHFMEDYYGSRCKLHYIRDKDGREVDFVTVVDGVVEDLIEVKLNKSDISTSLRYYSNKLKPKRTIQIVGNLKHPFDKGTIRVTHPIDFFNKPPWER